MTWDDERDAAFKFVTANLPMPIPAYDNCACCPWCGYAHHTVTFGEMLCDECGKCFRFGYPQWGSVVENRPESFVTFPFAEFNAMGSKAGKFPKFNRTKRLMEIYRDWWPEKWSDSNVIPFPKSTNQEQEQ